MKIIRITTDNELSVHDFQEGNCSEQNKVLRELIGPKCGLLEHVMPIRLYRELGGSNRAGKEMGSCVNMLIDEDGLRHNLDINTIGSYLYETDKHGHPIVGNVLIAGEVWHGNGISFCGMSEEQFDLLYPKFEELTKKARESA